MPVKGKVTKTQDGLRARRREKPSEKPKGPPIKVSVSRMLDDESSPTDPKSKREHVMTEDLPLPDDLRIEEWIQRGFGPGRYRVEYRTADGLPSEVIPVYIGDASVDYELTGDPEVDLRVRYAKLEGRVEGMRNGSHNGYDPVTKAVMERVVPEMLKPKSFAEQLRELREANELINPPRRETPAPQHQTDSNSERFKLLNSLIEHSDGSVKEMAIEKAIEWLKGEKTGQDVLMDVLQSPQSVQLAQTLINGLFGLADRILPPRQAQASTQSPQQQGSALTPQQQDWFNQVRQQQPQATDAQIYEYMRQKRLIQ